MMVDDDQSDKPRRNPRIGIAKGLFRSPDNIDEDNEEIARLFEESEIFPPERPAADEG